MSKSLGNIVDPIDVIEGISLEKLNENLKMYNLEPKELENAIKCQKIDFPQGIPECGTDALRFSLCAYTSQGKDINLDILRVQGFRFFCNKVWNAVKFLIFNFTDQPFTLDYCDLKFDSSNYESLNLIDKWILSKLDFAIETTNYAMIDYQLQKATTAIYNFWLYDLCDVYIETIKSKIKTCYETKKVLLYCVYNGLKILSPFMPYLTEELYQRLPIEKKEAMSITVSKYPKTSNLRNEQLEQDVLFVMAVVKSIRSTKEVYISTKSKAECKYFYLTLVNSL